MFERNEKIQLHFFQPCFLFFRVVRRITVTSAYLIRYVASPSKNLLRNHSQISHKKIKKVKPVSAMVISSKSIAISRRVSSSTSCAQAQIR